MIDSVVLRTLTGHRVRLRPTPDRQLTVAAFGLEGPEFIPGSSGLLAPLARAGIEGVTIRVVAEPADLYSSKPEVLVIGPYRPVDPAALTDLADVFCRAVRRVGADDVPVVIRPMGASQPVEGPWWEIFYRNNVRTLHGADLDQVSEMAVVAVRAVLQRPDRMYQLDVDSALDLLQSLALGFHVRAFYDDEIEIPAGEQILFGLPGDPWEENTDPETATFEHVRGMCEWIFYGPVRDYLDGGDDPTQSEPEPDRRTLASWSPDGARWSSFAAYLTWFVDQFHRYAVMMRDRLGPRLMRSHFAVTSEALEVTRLALGTVGLPLGQDETRGNALSSDEEGVLFPVERAELPRLITDLAAPVLAAVTRAEAEHRNTDPTRAVLEGHIGAVTSVAFSPDGGFLVSGGNDRTARIWDLAARRQVAVLRRHGGSVVSVVSAPDGSWLATGSLDGLIRIWNPDGWRLRNLLTVVPSGTDVLPLVVAPNGDWLAVGSDRERSIRRWETTDWRELDHLAVGSSGVHALAVESDSQLLLVRAPGDLVLMTLKGYRTEVTIDNLSPLVSLAYSAAGAIVVGGSSGGIKVANAPVAQVPQREIVGQIGPVNPVAVSEYQGKSLLAHADHDHSVWLLDCETQQPQGPSFQGHTAVVNALAFSPDATILASASDDGTVRLWDVDLVMRRRGPG